MIIVSNTTPIIALSSINQIHLLKDLFTKIYLPEAVYKEIKSKKRYRFLEVESDFFIIRSVQGQKYVSFLLHEIDEGEAEAITLAIELNADLLIIDERIGFKVATGQNLTCTGTLGVLSMAKKKGFIKNVKPFVSDLQTKGLWYSENFLQSFLRQENEA